MTTVSACELIPGTTELGSGVQQIRVEAAGESTVFEVVIHRQRARRIAEALRGQDVPRSGDLRTDVLSFLAGARELMNLLTISSATVATPIVIGTTRVAEYGLLIRTQAGAVPVALPEGITAQQAQNLADAWTGVSGEFRSIDELGGYLRAAITYTAQTAQQTN